MKIGIKYLLFVTIVLLPFCSNAQWRYKIINIGNESRELKIESGKTVRENDTLNENDFKSFCKVAEETCTSYEAIDYIKKESIVKNCKTFSVEVGNTINGIGPNKEAKNSDSLKWTEYENRSIDTLKYPEKRVAFLIGNSEYDHPEVFPVLGNVRGDIDGVRKRMNELSFNKVYSTHDLDNHKLQKAIKIFLNEAKEYDFVLIYFAGHGQRIGDNDYIIPVNAKENTLEEFGKNEKNEFRVDEIIKKCHELTRQGTIVLLAIDACRNSHNSYEVEYEITPTFDSICVIQSTMPSKTATGAKTFAEAFINICGSTGKSLENELREIVDSVELKSKQRPTIKNTIPRNSFFFYPKGSIPDKMKAKYYKTFNEAKNYFDNKEYGPALHRFETLPFFNDSICTYLAVCNYYWDNKQKADSLFKLADSAYNTKFFNEEYGKYLRERGKYREALDKLLKNADTSIAIQEKSWLLFKVPKYNVSSNEVKDSIGILYEILAEQNSIKKMEYLDSAFRWYERSNSPFARYRRLDLVNKEVITSVSNGFFRYETKQYRQLKRIIKKYNDYDAKYYLGKFNIENSKFTDNSRMHIIGVKWLEEDWDIGTKKAKKLLEQKRKPENNGSHQTSENNAQSFWPKWWNYTCEEWKFSDYWGVNFLCGNNGFDIACHYRHKRFSIGFGYGKFRKKTDDFFSENNRDKRGNYIRDKWVGENVECDFYGYYDTPIEKEPWMIYVEPGVNCSIATLSLGLGAFSINRSLDFWYTVDYHNGNKPESKRAHDSATPKFLLYPQLHFHLLSTELIHWRWGFGLTIEVGYRFNWILNRNENIYNRKEIIKQYNGITCGMGMEFAF